MEPGSAGEAHSRWPHLHTTAGTRTVHHRAGDAYLPRGDITAHRVTPPPQAGLRRTVLNFAYTTPAARPPRTDSAAEPHT
ncbi:HalD/BesD family halogenase [Streptomyces wedmorensis]